MSVITIAGEQLIATKINAGEGLTIDQFIFADIPGIDDDAPIDRNAGMPDQRQISTQLPVTDHGRVNGNTVVYSITMGSDIGAWYFNWIGLYSSIDNTLVAVAHVPRQEKTKTQGFTLGNVISKNFALEFNGASDLTGINIEAKSWQIDFTGRLNAMDAMTREIARSIYGQQAFVNDSMKVIYEGGQYKVKSGTAAVDGLLIERTADSPFLISTTPVDVWLAVSQVKGLSGLSNQSEIITGNLPPDMSGVKLATITSSSIIQDFRTILDDLSLNYKVDKSDSRMNDSREWNASTVSKTEAESGYSQTRRAWSSLRVRQAIMYAMNGFINKLNGVQVGATKNDTDANLKDRSKHTGKQAIDTILNLQSELNRRLNQTKTDDIHHIELSSENYSYLILSKSGIDQWHLGKSPSGEFFINRRNSQGGYVDSPLVIDHVSGKVKVNGHEALNASLRSNSTGSDSTNTIATSKAVKTAHTHATNAYHRANSAFNRATTPSEIGKVIKQMAVGDLGTYALLYKATNGGCTPGNTVAGSSLRYASTFQNGEGRQHGGGPRKPVGTWRCMGECGAANGANASYAHTNATLWMRIL